MPPEISLSGQYQHRRSGQTIVSLRFHYHRLRRDISNFSLIAHRDYTGFLISMHQSGTHWLKHMLATAIAHHHGLPAPRYSHANDIIGGPHDPRPYDNAPHIASSHSIPNALLGVPALHRVLRFPLYVVLVRDIRASLVANYEKWKGQYACSFSEFLRGDVSGRRFNHDIWWSVRFCNAWGKVACRIPAATLVVRYEDLIEDATRELRRINAFWALGVTDAALARAVLDSSKEKMALKADPETPDGVTVVRMGARPLTAWFNAGDRKFFSETCRRYLRRTFGYDYDDWPPASSS